MNLTYIIQKFSTEKACRKHLAKVRFPHGVPCVKCGAEPKRVSRIKTRDLYQCLECGYQYSPLVGTVFTDSHVPLTKWFLAIYLMCESKKSISASQIGRTIGVSYKTAWYLCHRIRAAMKNTKFEKLGGILEMDETYVGGKSHGKRGRGASGKTPVVGILQRSGRVVFSAINQVTSGRLEEILQDAASDEVELVITDEFVAYNGVGKLFRHKRINHSQNYVRGIIHTNGVENVWSLLKRSIVGAYHKVSADYLPMYLAELAFRFNNREEENIFDMVLQQA
jgi:transposase-like protein